MAHVARVENGIVREVHVIANDALPDGGAFTADVEAAANAFQHSLGLSGEWRLCSYNGNFRGTFPGPGWTYDAAGDQFIAPEVTAP